jgi:hypothetical protein
MIGGGPMRPVLVLAVVGLVGAFVWACGDGSASGTHTATDAGDEAAPGPPGAPREPLACATKGTFDPCGAPNETAEFAATQPDGGALLDQPDAGGGPSLEDGGTEAGADSGTCPASATRIACDTTRSGAQLVSFDIAADEGGKTQVAAWSDRIGAGLVIDAAGVLTPKRGLFAGDIRVFARDGFPTTYLTASSGSDSVYVEQEEGASERIDLGSKLGLDAFQAAGHAPDGTVYTIVRASQPKLITLPRGVKAGEATVRETTFERMGVDAASKPIFFRGLPQGGFLVSRNGTDDTDIAQPDVFPIAASSDADLPLIAARDRGDLAVFFALGTAKRDFAEMRIHRADPCVQSGCGYTCTEDAWLVPSNSVSFVRGPKGEPLLVYLESAVTQERTYSKESTIPCNIVGGCACRSTTEIKNVKQNAIVVMSIERGPLRLVERARLLFDLGPGPGEPDAGAVKGKKVQDRGLLTSTRGQLLHVGIPGAGGVLARVVVDLAPYTSR